MNHLRSLPLLVLPALALTAGAAGARPPVTLAVPETSAFLQTLAGKVSGVELAGAPGAEEALRKVSEGKAGFALVREDDFRQTRAQGLAGVGRVAFEHLHVLIRAPLRIESAGSFRRLRLAYERSSRLPAERFLGSMGRPLRPRARRLDPEEIREALRGGLADAVLLVAAPTRTGLPQGLEQGEFTLSSLDYTTLRSLLSQPRGSGALPPIEVGHLPAGIYPGQEEPVAAMAVPVWLVARTDRNAGEASRVLEAVRSAWHEAQPRLPLPEPRPEETRLPLLAGVNLPGAAASTAWKGLLLLALAAGLASLLALARRRGWHRALRRELLRDRLTLGLVLGLGLCVLLITLVTHLVEHSINESFSTFQESFWSITIYLFSGLEDRTPYTAPGRVVAALGLLLGPAFFAVLSGWLARFFIQRERRMPQNLRDHYLFLNWNDRAVAVARQLHHPVLLERFGTSVIVVLTDDEDLQLKRLKEAGSGRDEAFEDFYLSVGDPTAERGLLNANAQDARTILVFGDPQRGGDERTIRSLMMLRRIARDRGLDHLHVIVELLDAGNDPVLDELARDFPGLLERVSGLQVRTCLLAQAALNAGMVQFYTDLLQVSAESNEVYTLPLPEGAVGLDFRDYAARILLHPMPDPLTPVGIQRNGDGPPRILTNPRPGCEESRLRPGDRLVVLSQLPPDPASLPE